MEEFEIDSSNICQARIQLDHQLHLRQIPFKKERSSKISIPEQFKALGCKMYYYLGDGDKPPSEMIDTISKQLE